MKKISVVFFTFLLTLPVFCQDFDKLLLQKTTDCSDISHSSSLYFIRYMGVREIDSTKNLLTYWENKCGMREPVFRAKILLALIAEDCIDSLWTETLFNQIFNYQSRMDMIKSARYYIYDNHKSFYGYVPPGEEFDIFTRKLAAELKTYYNSESIEYALAEFYSDDYEALFLRLQSKTLEDCLLSKKYYEIVNKYKGMPEFQISFFSGIWIPTGDLAKIGLHPELGMQIGWKKKRLNYDFTIALKFIDAPKNYYARRDKGEEWELTNHFFGGYIGFEVGGDLLSRKGHEIQVISGVGYDVFGVLKENREDGLKSSSTSSFNINFGFAYRYYVSNNFFLGLRVKYNIVDYTLNKVIDFTGNPISVHFSIGIVRNAVKDSNLKALRYNRKNAHTKR